MTKDDRSATAPTRSGPGYELRGECDRVARSFIGLSLLPLHGLAEARNQSIRSLLQDITGLSKARISKGNLDAVRPSTHQKIEQHLETMLQEQFKNCPEDLEAFKAKMAAAPVTSSGAPAPLSGWIHTLEDLPSTPLPMTKAAALVIDELVEALLACCRNDDLDGFKVALMSHLERHGTCVRYSTETTAEPVTEADLQTLRTLTDWQEAEGWTRKLPDLLYWDLISSLDAEWGNHYFAGRQKMPLFPLVMVRPQEGLLETMKVTSRRNVYFRPVRRLLELLYAMAFHFRHKRWPAKAPTPKTLAGILYRPGSDELADERLISNYFDGTTKLTQDLVLEHWIQLVDYFSPRRPDGKRLIPPLPMIMLALQWQTLLIRDEGRSFLMPDLNRYESLWAYRVEQIQAPQRPAGRPGQSTDEPINWPAWSLNQSSSSF